MLRLVGRRLLMAVPLLFIVSVLSFVLASFTPGTGRPVREPYGDWLAGAVRGDLGSSMLTGEPVTALLTGRMSITLSLAVAALLLALVLGVALNTRRADFGKSLRAGRNLLVHTLRDAAAPLLPSVGLIFVSLLGWTVLVEQIFGLGGLGALAVTATTQQDLPVVQGIVVLYTLAVVAVFLVLDVLSALVNRTVVAG